MRPSKTRLLAFLLCVGLFLISAPLVVLSTAGYRWSPAQGLVKTGTILASTLPNDAQVFLDEVEQRATTPTVLKTLLPGTYTVEFHAPNHTPWRARVPVLANTTTFVTNALLLSTKPATRLVAGTLRDAAWSDDGEYVAWVLQEAGWNEIWASSRKDTEPHLLYRTAHDPSLTIAWVADQLHVSTKTESLAFSALTWSSTRVQEPDVTLTASNDGVSVVYRGRTFARLPAGTYAVVDVRDPFITLMETQRNTLFLLTVADETNPLLLQESAMMFRWLGRDRLAYADPYGLHVYTPATHTTTLITRLSEPMLDIAWHPTASALFYTTQRGLFVLDTDPRFQKEATAFVADPSTSSLFVHPRGRVLLYVSHDPINPGLFEKEIY